MNSNLLRNDLTNPTCDKIIGESINTFLVKINVK